MNPRKSLDKGSYSKNPTETDFAQYFPWTCYQFQLNFEVYVEKVLPQGITSGKRTSRLKSPHIEVTDRLKTMHVSLILPTIKFNVDERKVDTVGQPGPSEQNKSAEVQIKAIYNREHNLVELNFPKCKKEGSEKLIKILQFIISYYPTLTSIIMKQNINSSTLNELSKLLLISNITEVTLDGCSVKEGNYYVLIQELDKLNKLSLARCNINDDIVQALAKNLGYLQQAAKTLHILNLSSNIITDEGAKIFAEVLRTNRHLYYLNLANNRIEDEGAFAIFDVLLEFPMNHVEQESFHKRHWDFVKMKNELVQKYMIDLKLKEDATILDDNILNSAGKDSKKSGKNINSIEMVKSKSKLKAKSTNFHQIDLKDKAVAMADKVLAEYEEPFENAYKKYNTLHYAGNHTLRILNLAYNNLTYLAVKKLFKVLEHQKLLNRDPIGLVNVCIEGNYLPKSCVEFQLIDEILNNTPSSVLKGKKRNNNSARSSITNHSK